MKNLFKVLFSIGAFGVLAVQVSATPVLFPLQQITGNARLDKFTVAADPALNPQTDGQSLIGGFAVTTNSGAVLNLVPGSYLLSAPGWSRTLRFNVNDGAAVVNVVTLITNGLASYTPVAIGLPTITGAGLQTTQAGVTNVFSVDYSQVASQSQVAALTNTAPAYAATPSGQTTNWSLTAPDGVTRLLNSSDRSFLANVAPVVLTNNASYLQLADRPLLDVCSFGARVDGVTIYNRILVTNKNSAYITTTVGSAKVIVTNWNFTAADTGKNVEVCFGGSPTNLPASIAAVIDTNTITLSVAIPVTNQVWNLDYGHDDTAAVQAAINYIATNSLAGTIYIPNNGKACFIDGPWVTNLAAAQGPAIQFYSILTLPSAFDYMNNASIVFAGDSPAPMDDVGGSRILCSRWPNKAFTMTGSGVVNYFGGAMNYVGPFCLFGAPYGYSNTNGVNTGGYNLIKIALNNLSFETSYGVNYTALNFLGIGSVDVCNVRSGNNYSAGLNFERNLGLNISGAAGIIMPFNYNHVDNSVDHFVSLGHNYSVIFSECCTLDHIYSYGDWMGVMQVAADHVSHLRYIYPYGTLYEYIASSNLVTSSDQSVKVVIDALDCENANWQMVWDPGQVASGVINFYDQFNGYWDPFAGGNVRGDFTKLRLHDIKRNTDSALKIGSGGTNFAMRYDWTNRVLNFSDPGKTNFLQMSSAAGLTLNSGQFTGNGAGLSNVTATLPATVTSFGTNVVTGVYAGGSNSPSLTTNAAGITVHVPIYGYDYYEFPSPTGAINELGNTLWTIGPGTNQVNYSYAIPLTLFYGKTNFIFTLTLCTTNSSWIALRMQNIWYRRDAASPVFYSDGNRISEYESFITPAGTNTFDVMLTNALQQSSFAWPINSTNINAAYIGVLNYTNTMTYRIVRATLKSYPQ